MSDNLKITITGSNQSHQAFQQVTSDAKAMGTAVEDAGNKSGRSLQQINQRAAAFGAALGGATLLMGEFAKAAAEDEASQARLEQSVTNTGASLDDYSAKLEVAIKQGQEKAFSDDQTRDALVKLNLATNDTAKSIEELGLVMDFSRAKGISLGTSAEVIGKVMGGNLGILSRYGIILDENATKEEALAAIQQRVAGQAQTYAETSLGRADVFKDRIDELTEAWGAHAGALQSVLLLLPGLQAGYVALAGVLGGIGGLGALGAIAGPLALVAGGASLAYGYSQDDIGTTQTNKFWNNFFKTGSDIMNVALPGTPYDTKKYTDQMNQNQIGDLINQILRAPGENQSVVWDRVAQLTGVTTGEMSTDELIKTVTTAAANRGMQVDKYLAMLASTSSEYSLDPTTNTYLPNKQYASIYQTRVGTQFGYTGAATMGYGAIAGATYGGVSPEARAAAMRPHGAPMEFDPSAMMARAGGIPEGGGSGFLLDAAANAEKTTAALKKTLGAYYDLVTGMDVAGGAAEAFKATQDGLIDRQDVYSQQIGEFSAQQNALTAARDILITRQEEGITLTKQEQELLDNYPDLYERVSGGVDDATVAQGLLAAQYIENMKTGDQLNETMAGNTESTSELVNTVDRLILSMAGIPEEVKTQILLDLSDESVNDLINYYNWLNRIPSSITTVVETVFVEGAGGTGGRVRGALHGGVVGYDNGGVVIHAGEAGPEYMSFANGGSAWAMHDSLYNVPRGTYVTPAPASVGKSSSGLHFNGPVSITVVANDPRQMAAAINEWAVGSSRS